MAARDPELLVEIVVRCVRVKGAIVSEDESEAGARKTLNLGHTFAHGIEHAAGFGKIPHGIAVGTGLCLALEAGRRSGVLRDAALPGRTARVLEALGLCASLRALRERYAVPLAGQALASGMRHDKKGAAGEPAFVLPEGLAAVRVDCSVDPAIVTELLA